MHPLSKLSLLIALTLMVVFVTATPMPAPEAQPFPLPEPLPMPTSDLDLSNITVLSTGTVTMTGPGKRRSVPPGCAFESVRGDYTYVQFKLGNGHSACYGWNNWACSRNAKISKQDLHDMGDAVEQQFAQDGQWKITKVGRWTANFALGTTAMSDRSANSYFTWAQQVCGYGIKKAQQAYYISYDSDFITVTPKGNSFC